MFYSTICKQVSLSIFFLPISLATMYLTESMIKSAKAAIQACSEKYQLTNVQAKYLLRKPSLAKFWVLGK